MQSSRTTIHEKCRCHMFKQMYTIVMYQMVLVCYLCLPRGYYGKNVLKCHHKDCQACFLLMEGS